jgi:hypothetical protein
MVGVAVLRAVTFSLPFLMACVSAHAQELAQSTLSSATDWLRGPPPPKPSYTVDAGAPTHPGVGQSPTLPRPRRPAALAPITVRPDSSKLAADRPAGLVLSPGFARAGAMSHDAVQNDNYVGQAIGNPPRAAVLILGSSPTR